MSNTTVGVVMTAYNADDYLAAAVSGMRGQTLTDWACVVVDDGSSDSTLELAHTLTGDDKRFTVVTQANGGVASARNLGLAHLRPSRYVTFHDHDDRYHPTALGLLVQAAQMPSSKHCVGAHGLPRRIDAFGEVKDDDPWWSERTRSMKVARRGRLHAAEGASRFETLITQCTIYPPSLILTERCVADRLGGFDEDTHPYDDWDWMIRASRYGDYCFLPEVILDYRIHGKNRSTQAPQRDLAFFEAVRTKTARSSENNPDQKRAVRATWRAVELGHARDLGAATLEATRARQLKAAVRAGSRTALAMARSAAGRPTFLG